MRVDLHYGVSVGINKYPGVSDLHLAKGDAIEFDKWLCQAGVPESNRKLITVDDAALPEKLTPRNARPTDREIWYALSDQMEKVQKHVDDNPGDWPETRLYFYFSGHGLAPDGLDTSGLTANFEPDYYRFSVSMMELKASLATSQHFAEVVIIADCCRNDPPLGAQTGGPPWIRKPHHKGIDVMFAEYYATGYGDFAREPQANRDTERGYFTRAILDGLKGDPLAKDGEVITTQSLGDFARQRVIDVTGEKQKPAPYQGADFVLAEQIATTPARDRSVRVTFPAEAIGKVTLRDWKFQELAVHLVTAPDLVVSLPPDLYQFTADGLSLEKGLFSVHAGDGEQHVSL